MERKGDFKGMDFCFFSSSSSSRDGYGHGEPNAYLIKKKEAFQVDFIVGSRTDHPILGMQAA
jgi:hypothetical protein